MQKMNISEVKELIKAVSESELTAFDYQEGNINISLRKAGAEVRPAGFENKEQSKCDKIVEQNLNAGKQEESKTAQSLPSEDVKEPPTGNVVKSPLVGTAYMAPEEGEEPFVKVGDTVKKGQTLAIVEAMKLMNEIESDYDGVVKEILIENGQTVEYGQEMFVIG